MDDSQSIPFTTHLVDFPPALRPAPRHDLALLRVAHAAWADCREQWQQLLLQGPSLDDVLGQAAQADEAATLKARWGAYWKTRAPRSPRARRNAAVVLLGKHLQAAVQWSYGTGQLDADELEPALCLLEGGDALARAGGSVQTVARVLPAEGGVELAAALVLQLGAAAKPLLYVPGAVEALHSFASIDALEAELGRRLESLWPQPREVQDGPAQFAFTAITAGKAFNTLLNQLMRAFYQEAEQALRDDSAALQLAVGPRPYPATEAVLARFTQTHYFAVPPALPAWEDAAAAAPALELGGLQAGTALEARWSQVARQREAVERYLQGDDDGAHRRQRFTALQAHDQALRQARQAANEAAQQLLARDDLQGLLALRIDTEAPFQRLYEARLAGLRAELAIQALLLPLDAREQRLLSAWLDAPGASTDGAPAVEVSILTVVAHDDLPQRQELDGALVIECPGAEGEPPSQWLYWPGTGGGMQRFSSRAALQHQVFGVLPEHTALAVEYAAILGDGLAYSLKNQLHACEQQAMLALTQGLDAQAQGRELQRLQVLALEHWAVPEQQARDLVLAQVNEQEQGERLAAVLPHWLQRHSAEQREQLQGLAREYERASGVALTLLAQALPPRAVFAEQAVQALLKQRFGEDDDYRVVLDLPETVSVRYEASGKPVLGATAQEGVRVPSAERVKVPLAQLALDNIDGPMLQRLQFLAVEISGGNEAGRHRYQQSIDIPWLQRFVEELDLADAYERRLRSAFIGSAGEPAFVTAYRRESLVAPFRLILTMQAQCLAQRHEGNAAAAWLASTAIDAASEQQWQPPGQRIVLRAATFTAGGADTGELGTTLSGVNFIEEQVSGLTVLVLPDCPDGRWLRSYSTLEEARQALFDLCLDAPFARYLAGRALAGDPAQHLSRLNTALGKHFTAMIGIGSGWPATKSLAEHLLDAHMGRLIQAHRDTSRSNDALYLEQAALGIAMVLVYIKMAMSVLPFVGTAVALYDAWESANRAVEAFLEKDGAAGLMEIQAVLISLMDAAMDLLPGAMAPAPGTARRLVRQRQLQRLSSGVTPLQGHRQHLARAFEGYEYGRDVRLLPLERGTHGLYRNVYRHADGHFIVRDGRIYAIELADSPRTWRLSGTATKTYKQPIALDDSGQWQSHGNLYGTLVKGGLAGGGGVLGHLADGIDPYWPAAVRERLPRWWGDRLFRQQMRMLEQGQRSTDVLDAQLLRTRKLQLQKSPAVPKATLEAAFKADIELAIQAFEGQAALLAVVHGRKATDVQANMSRAATVVVERSVQRAMLGEHKVKRLLAQIRTIAAGFADELLSASQIAERLRTVALLQEQLAVLVESIDRAAVLSRQWYPKVTLKLHKDNVGAYYNAFHESYSLIGAACRRTSTSVEALRSYRPGVDLIEYLSFGVRSAASANRLQRSLHAHRSLLEVRGSAAQRKRILEQCVEEYVWFRQQLRIWEAGDGEFINAAYFDIAMSALQRNIDDARAWLAKLPGERVTPSAGAASQRIFETVDERLLVGEQVPATASAPAQFRISGAGGVDEVYIQGEGGKWSLQSPVKGHLLPSSAASLKQLKRRAQGRLDRLPAYRAKVDGYSQQGMSGKDVEHLLVEEARELSRLARQIAEQEADAALIARLDDAATRLQGAGRTQRISKALSNPKPTEGDLDYLLQARQVVVRKLGPVVELRKRPDGRRDFMQEYEVRRVEPNTTLWYAHFHYDQLAPKDFASHVKGHLKTVAERYVGRQWQAETGAAEPWRGDIGRNVANTHFAAL